MKNGVGVVDLSKMSLTDTAHLRDQLWLHAKTWQMRQKGTTVNYRTYRGSAQHGNIYIILWRPCVSFYDIYIFLHTQPEIYT